MTDLHAEVAAELIEAKETFYASVRDAYDAGLPIGRIIGLIGFQNAQHICGAEVCEPWRLDRGYSPRRGRDIRQHPPAPTPAAMPRSRNT